VRRRRVKLQASGLEEELRIDQAAFAMKRQVSEIVDMTY